LVQALRGAGKTEEQIATQIGERGVAVETLKRAFAHELATGKERIHAICMMGIVNAMLRGEAWACCFYAKTQMGFREKSDVNLTGAVKHEHSNIERLAAELDLIAARTGKTPVS